MNFKKTLALLAVLVIFGIFAVIKVGVEKEKSDQKAMEGKFFPYKFGDVVGMDLTNSDVNIQFQKNASGEWRIIKPVMTRAEYQATSLLVKTLTDLEITREFDISKELQPAAFGLEPPEYQLTIETTFADTVLSQTLLFGKVETFNSESIYAMIENDSSIVLVDKGIENELKKSVYDYRDKDIVHANKNTIQKITIQNDETIVLEKSGDDWMMTAPVNTRGNLGKITSLLNTITGGFTSEFIEDNPENLEKYGLNPPRKTITFTQRTKGEVSLFIGKTLPGEDGKYYAKESLSPAIFITDNIILKAINAPISDYYDKKVLDFDEEMMDELKIHFAIEPKLDMSASKDEKGNWAVTLNDSTINDKSEKIEQLIRTLKNLSWRELAKTDNSEKEKYGLDNPHTTVEILKNGEMIESLIAGKIEDDDTFVTGSNTNWIVKVTNINVSSLRRNIEGISTK